MAFDPDAFLSKNQPTAPAQFNPDAFLAKSSAVREQEPDWGKLYSEVNTSPVRKMEGATDELEQKFWNDLDFKARTTNQLFIQSKMPGLSKEYINGNYEAVKREFSKQYLGEPVADGAEVRDVSLYSSIKNKLKADADNRTKVGMFWDEINKPIAQLKAAPKDMPDMPQLGFGNPALVGGVYNAIKPVLEGGTSIMGIGTLGVGTELKSLSETHKAAGYALGGMSGLFALMMGSDAVREAPEAKRVVEDPNSTTEEKIEAVSKPIVNAGMAILGALGAAHEIMPEKKSASLNKLMQGRTPAESAQIIRNEIGNDPSAVHNVELEKAAQELEKIDKSKPIQNIESAAIRTEDGQVLTGATHDEIRENHPLLFEEPPMEEVTAASHEEGFLTDKGQFVNREVAANIAKENGQMLEAHEGEKKLHSHMVDMPAVPNDLISIKNETIDTELEKMGERPATHDEKITFKGALESANAKLASDPKAAETLVDDLAKSSRPITGEEDALLLTHLNRLKLERNAAENVKMEAIKSGDEAAIASARLRVEMTRDAFMRASDVVTKVGTKNAQGLALRRMMMREDYSLASLERRMTVANDGKPLSPEQEATIRELQKKYDETLKAFEDYRKEQEGRERVVNEPSAKPAKPVRESKVKRYIAEQAEEARKRILARSREGRVLAGIDPADLADHIIIGADYLAKGVTKFDEWSSKMVDEFGDKIKPYLKEIFAKSSTARDDVKRLGAFKTRTEKSIQRMQEQLKTGDFSKKPRRPIPLDSEAIRLKADHERVKQQVRLMEHQMEMANRSVSERTRDFIVKWNRIGALSWLSVQAKLFGAAVLRTVSTPLEQVAGYGLSKALPGLAERAPREGVPELSGALKAEAAALREMFTTGIKGSGALIRGKTPPMEMAVEGAKLPAGLDEVIGNVFHKSIKYPTKINEFARSLELRSQHALKNGVDITDPVQQMRLFHEANIDANRAIFMQDNTFVDSFRAAVGRLKNADPKKYNSAQREAAAWLATGIETEIPIVKVPSNVIAETTQIIGGLLTGSAKAAWEYAHGIENLSPIEADATMRLLKKGMVGAALAAIGFFSYENFGGYREQGEQRRKDELQPLEVKAGDVTVPSQLTHNPYFSEMQFYATMRKAMEKQFKKGAIESSPIGSGVLAASIGLIEESPFIRETTTIGKYMSDRTASAAMKQKAASFLVPGAIQWVAAQLDKKTPFDPTDSPRQRKAETFMENVQKGIPVLREDLPERNIYTKRRGKK